MSAARELLAELGSRGLTVRVVAGGKLIVGPKPALDAQLLHRMREHKSELLTALAQRSPQQCRSCPKVSA